MDTVSYLTINDETKEIADLASRNDIDDIKLLLAAYRTDIDDIQLETGSNGSLTTAINNAYTMALAAQSGAASATEAASTAWDKADSASQAAELAWDQAGSAVTAANIANEKADEASRAAGIAEARAAQATDSANVAWNQAQSATAAAEEAWDKADDAGAAASQAQQKAEEAGIAANEAKSGAVRANNYALGALGGLSTLQSVVDTVNWFRDHRVLTSDTVVDVEKSYYAVDPSTGTMSKVDPNGQENPSEEGWYEIDETIQNYITSRVAETNDGLYILSTTSGWRILISAGGDHFVPGVFIMDPAGVIKQALTGDGISFDRTSPFYIGDDNAYILFEPPYKNSYGNDEKGHIKIVATDQGTVDISGQVNIGGTGKTLTEVLEDIGHSIQKIEYGKGDSPTTHDDILEWSEETPEWEADKYIWMRTSSLDNLYTYTCIQGAKGDPGEAGPAGPKGPEGVGVESVEVYYATSDSEFLTGEEEWRKSVFPEPESEEQLEGEGSAQEPSEAFSLPQGTWLWVKTETIYTNGMSDATYQQSYIGTDGKDGESVFIKSTSKVDGVTTITLIDSEGNEEILTINDGEDGANGQPGAAGYIHVAWANSADGKTDFSTTNSENKKYLGVYTDNVESDSENEQDYSWSLIKGEKGDAAYSYSILSNPSVLVKAAVSDTPAPITFTSKRSQGTNSPIDYSGRFVISTSIDGISWTTQYTSASNESNKKYFPAADVRFVRCQLYSAGGVTSLLDTQTVPIISNGAPGEQGEGGKILNISPDIYTESTLPDIETAKEADAYLVDDGDGQYDLYYKGTNATSWTVIENWQGAKGPQGDPGVDAYTVMLTNESHTFAASTNAAIASNTTCNVVAYKGATQVTATIAEITGQVNGLTTSISNNNTTSPYFTVSVTSALTTKNGVLTIPIVVDGKSFEKKFSWSLSLQGAKGDQGNKGDKGDTGQTGATGPEAVVTITPTNINWSAGTATLNAILRVNGAIITPTGYNWTKGTAATSLGTAATLNVTDLNTTYNCTVTW